MKRDDLSPRQRRFVAAMLTARTVAEAAAAVGVTERTGYKYLGDPAVKAELSKRQDQVVALAVASLSELGQDAIQSLRESLVLLSDHAGGNVGDFITVDDAGHWSLDLAAAKDAGKLHLVKKL